MEERELPAFGDGINSSNRRKRRNFGNIECEYEDVSGLHDSGDDVVMRVRKMMFRTIEEAEKLYIAYGREIGFDIRTQKVQTTKPNKFIQSIKWVCNREGHRKERADCLFRERESRPETRLGCKAFLRVAYHRYSGCYRVANFKPNHNHELATTETSHLLRCNRRVLRGDKSKIADYAECQATTVLHVQRILQTENGMKISIQGPGIKQIMPHRHKTVYLTLVEIAPAKSKSISSGFGVLLKEHGVRGFFRGWVPTLHGYSAQGACKFWIL